ncbi:MAG TPA: response regulator, partial [candidate division Zixibacteria bacterium]|nr:response regulator [candidate division Zixibacteria bacterium]
PYLDLAHFAVILAGLLLAAAGLAFYADGWQTRREDIEVRDQKLSILDNLQRDARGPYQLVDLLSMSIREIVSHLPDAAGAVFLLNRKHRQFVLTASVGLSQEETALLEYFPLQRNTVSQSIDIGEPILGRSFSFIERSGAERPSRFQSVLVLPLVSGMEKIGGILLVAEAEHYFSRAEIRYLQPVAEWIAEKIKSARLERELTAAVRQSEERAQRGDDLATRLRAATAALGARDGVAAFCRALAGVAESRSVHLFGLTGGALQFYGGSESLGDISENYRTALVDALDRNKPLVINQEGVGDGGRKFVAVSSLVAPLGGREASALLLRREDGPFRVDDDDLKQLELFGGLARLALQRADTERLDLTRRKGFETVLQLLRFDVDVEPDKQPDFFTAHMAPALPAGSLAVLFRRENDGSFTAVGGAPGAADLRLLPGEGIVGEAANRAEGRFVFSRAAVGRAIEALESGSREQMQALFGEQGVPGFAAACPILRLDRVAAVALFLLYDATESERGEWERLLTLASSLYSVRLTVAELNRRVLEAQTTGGGVDQDLVGRMVNELNNHLSAVIGNAELAFTRTNLTGDVAQHLRSVIAEAEQAAKALKDSLGRMRLPAPSTAVAAVEDKSLGAVVKAVLRRLQVAENLYLAGGRAREMAVLAEADGVVPVAEERLYGLVEEMLNRFGAAAADDDVLTLRLYRSDDRLCLDLSRHHRNFPPVDKVAGFGEYEGAPEALRQRPSDTFLRYLADSDVTYAHDRHTQPSTYLSFQFPTAAPGGSARAARPKEAVRILAIDDQTVILDLIAAMSQSMGYEVAVASSGPEGIALARRQRFTLVLTDLAMPGMSGLEVAAEIRKLQPDTPIVLVTGWEVTTDRAQLEEAGIVRVLYKPFRIEQLTEIIRSAVQISPI